MSRFASVLAKSPLIQLDRAFDYLIPEAMGEPGRYRAGSYFSAWKVEEGSGWLRIGAVRHKRIRHSSDNKYSRCFPGCSPAQLLEFLRAVADRQCVALGESSWPLPFPITCRQSQRLPAIQPRVLEVDILVPKLDSPLGSRAAVLTSARQLEVAGALVPDWTPIANRYRSRRPFTRASLRS